LSGTPCVDYPLYHDTDSVSIPNFYPIAYLRCSFGTPCVESFVLFHYSNVALNRFAMRPQDLLFKKRQTLSNSTPQTRLATTYIPAHAKSMARPVSMRDKLSERIFFVVTTLPICIACYQARSFAVNPLLSAGEPV
jgi:hypothetical protein